MQKHQVQALLMGGQACVFYGAAQFSKDINLLLLADEANFAGLRSALDELGAHRIAVPGFDLAALARGHAVHFRCQSGVSEPARGGCGWGVTGVMFPFVSAPAPLQLEKNL